MSLGACLVVYLLFIAALVVVVSGSYGLLRYVNDVITAEDANPWAVILLFIPFLFLYIWCFLLSIVLTIVGLFIGYQLVKSIRDWWQIGAK